MRVNQKSPAPRYAQAAVATVPKMVARSSSTEDLGAPGKGEKTSRTRTAGDPTAVALALKQNPAGQIRATLASLAV